MRCPGQDRRYWTEDAVFDAPCPKCDAPVEFFKDEGAGRCTRCGHRFRNPKVSFDCAKWCAFAEQCLGFAPERQGPSDPGEGALASRLIRSVKEEFDSDRPRIARALAVFQHARELLSKEGGDPRIVLAAALLIEVGRGLPAPTDGRTDGSLEQGHNVARARRIMGEIGLDEDTTQCVCHMIESSQLGKEPETIEFEIVSDAYALAQISLEGPGDDLDRLRQVVDNELKTKSGKAKGRSLLEIYPRDPGS